MAAGSTYTPIATTTLGSAAASYTFSSIPSTYTDLVIIANTSSVSSGVTIRFRLNGDSGSNYSMTDLYGTGTSAASARVTNQTSGEFGYHNGASTFTVSRLNLMNYSNATTYKTGLARDDDAASTTIAYATLWRSTSAINSVEIFMSSGNISAGSTFTLYGIAAA